MSQDQNQSPENYSEAIEAAQKAGLEEAAAHLQREEENTNKKEIGLDKAERSNDAIVAKTDFEAMITTAKKEIDEDLLLTAKEKEAAKAHIDQQWKILDNQQENEVATDLLNLAGFVEATALRKLGETSGEEQLNIFQAFCIAQLQEGEEEIDVTTLDTFLESVMKISGIPATSTEQVKVKLSGLYAQLPKNGTKITLNGTSILFTDQTGATKTWGEVFPPAEGETSGAAPEALSVLEPQARLNLITKKLKTRRYSLDGVELAIALGKTDEASQNKFMDDFRGDLQNSGFEGARSIVIGSEAIQILGEDGAILGIYTGKEELNDQQLQEAESKLYLEQEQVSDKNVQKKLGWIGMIAGFFGVDILKEIREGSTIGQLITMMTDVDPQDANYTQLSEDTFGSLVDTYHLESDAPTTECPVGGVGKAMIDAVLGKDGASEANKGLDVMTNAMGFYFPDADIASFDADKKELVIRSDDPSVITAMYLFYQYSEEGSLTDMNQQIQKATDQALAGIEEKAGGKTGEIMTSIKGFMGGKLHESQVQTNRFAKVQSGYPAQVRASLKNPKELVIQYKNKEEQKQEKEGMGEFVKQLNAVASVSIFELTEINGMKDIDAQHKPDFIRGVAAGTLGVLQSDITSVSNDGKQITLRDQQIVTIDTAAKTVTYKNISYDKKKLGELRDQLKKDYPRQ